MKKYFLLIAISVLSCLIACNTETENKTDSAISITDTTGYAIANADTAHKIQGSEKVENIKEKVPDISDTLQISIEPKYHLGAYKVAAGTITNISSSTIFENLRIEVFQQTPRSYESIGTHSFYLEKFLPQTTVKFETNLEVNNAVTTLYQKIISVERTKKD